jgi:hypothetical protein
MDQFEIEPSTGEDLSENIKNVSKEENNELIKVYDDFDLTNCLLACSFKAVSIIMYQNIYIAT